MNLTTVNFNLEATLESGQVFGFTKAKGPAYSGVISGTAVRLSQNNNRLTVNGKIGREKVRDYFDLNKDITPIYEILKTESLWTACEKIQGLRLIRQDSWEALACFILSSNNNVKRIQGIWKNLSHYFREPSVKISAFPEASRIASCHERILRQLGLGYRAPFLLRTAQFISKNPEYLLWIREAGYEEAKRRVLAFPGIGEKVADCVLLYGFQKYEAFPVDVWILRVMKKLYFKHSSVSEEKVRRFANKRWGGNAGYIQQYLFHGARSGVL